MSRKLKSKRLRLYLCTWNVGASPPNVDFTDVFDLKSPMLPDIYGIGLQECGSYDLSMEEHPWTKALTKCLSGKGYVKLKCRRMRGVMTLIFSRRQWLPYITSIESEFTRTGFGGWWGNKGGTSVRFDLFGMNLIVVNVHLAAHQENASERIVDYNSILDEQKFKDDDVDNILDHDYVFWLGDLNFRLEDMTYDDALRYIRNNDMERLLSRDQLHMCMEERLILEDFEEGDITFMPTYKFDKGTDTYDSSRKKRVPAWCDRILWHVYPECYGCVNLDVRQLDYRSHPKYHLSDHKPVTSLFEIEVFGCPPPAPVEFQTLTTWYLSQDLTLSYTVSVKSSSSDWIGLYKSDFTSFHDYVSYIWAPEGAEKEGKRGMVVLFPFSKLSVKPGKYVFCYMTKKYSLQGITDEFVIAP